MVDTELKNTEWEADIYRQGTQLNRYPFDPVVTFVNRYVVRDRPIGGVRILEIGCGAGNNLWFAAREGLSVAGIDSSPSAIAYAQRRFREDGLAGDLRVGDFTALPFKDVTFDLAIDRCAMTYVGFTAAARTVSEIHRVLKPAGKIYCNLFSDSGTSARSGICDSDGLRRGITEGSLTGNPAVCFWSRQRLLALFRKEWELLSVEHVEIDNGTSLHAEWRTIAQRLSG